MASSNADHVVIATVPGFRFPVDALNVATPHNLRDGKDKNRTLVSRANVRNSVYWFPANKHE
jgi:hypothetical protein